jgi:Mn2+/Fe2+ NRAMP family transporter
MRRVMAALAPGMLIAATGVGAGDLAVASLTGSRLGNGILWAVLAGAALKFTLNEGLARWQLATGETLLEGAMRRLGRPVAWIFMPYLVAWSFFVGSALISACGVCVGALVPVFDDPNDAKLVFGIAQSAIGLALVWGGGFALFERVMGVCIAIMFVSVIVTAAVIWPGWAEVGHGLLVPGIPDAGGSEIGWTVALMGGVGGTVTILSYGYWIREKGRVGLSWLRVCRIDLAAAYIMTAAFGIGMVIIGSTITIEGSGVGLIVKLADRLESSLGPAGRWLFLLGAWGAVFTSLLGVWQAVPYIFADMVGLIRERRDQGAGGGGEGRIRAVDTRSRPYRGYLLAIATVPILGLLVSFKDIQKYYAVVGAGFMPVLALALLVLCGRRAWIGSARTRLLGTAALLVTMGFFAWAGLKGWSE